MSNAVFKEIGHENPLYVAIIENGKHLYVYEGYAKDLEGNTYHSILKENEDGDAEPYAWRLEDIDEQKEKNKSKA